MKATSESSSNLGSPISMRDVLIRVWDQGYQSPHFRRSRFRPDGITFRITIACRQFPYSAAFTTNINWKKSRLEKFRMSYLRSIAVRTGYNCNLSSKSAHNTISFRKFSQRLKPPRLVRAPRNRCGSARPGSVAPNRNKRSAMRSPSTTHSS